MLVGSYFQILRRLWLKRLVAVAGLTLFTGLMACQRQLTPQQSCQFLQNQDRQRVSWNDAVPVPLYIHSSVPPEAYESIEAAIKTYDEVLGHKSFEIRGYGSTGPSTPTRDGYSIIYWMADWEPERAKEQGRTTVYWSGNTIYEADIRINASERSGLNFHMLSSPPVPATVDLKSLFIHELGHALGLDHSDLAGSIMNTHLEEGRSRAILSDNDVANLKCEYALGG